MVFPLGGGLEVLSHARAVCYLPTTAPCRSTELMRTEVRATALGVLAAAGRCGSVAAQFVNGTYKH